MVSRSTVPMSMQNGPGATRSKRTRPPARFTTVMSSVVLRPLMICSSAPASPSLVSLLSPLFQMKSVVAVATVHVVVAGEAGDAIAADAADQVIGAGPPTMLSSPAPPSIVSVPAAVRVCAQPTVESKSVASREAGGGSEVVAQAAVVDADDDVVVRGIAGQAAVSPLTRRSRRRWPRRGWRTLRPRRQPRARRSGGRAGRCV